MPAKFKTPSKGKVSKFGFRQRKQETLTSNESECLTTQFTHLHVRESSQKINPAKTYIGELHRTKRYFALSQPSFFAVADCDETGKLTKKYCLLEKLDFTDGLENDNLFTCSCSAATTSRKRLTSMCKELKHEPLSRFIRREKEDVCIHVQSVDRLFIERTIAGQTDNFNEDYTVDQLSASPLLVAVFVEDEGYGIVQLESSSTSKPKLVCASCKTNVHFCEHVKAYKNWSKTQNIEMDFEMEYHCDMSSDELSFQSISNQRIPYPLPDYLREKFDGYESQTTTFPVHFFPMMKSGTCSHGNAWDDRDPVEMGWIASTSVKIHKAHITLNADDGEPRYIYFRPTVGGCKCKLSYDGQEDLLFNLDNQHVVYYGVMFQYLFSMVHTGSPLVSMHRHFSATNAVMSNADIIPLSVLRRAWNAFARLLDIDFTHVFVCQECGSNPEVIICDGTDVGMKKDLIPDIAKSSLQGNINLQTQLIRGSKHSDRTYIKSPACRRLLLKLAGEKQGQRRKQSKALNHISLSITELKSLKDLLRKEGKSHLIEIVDEVNTLKAVPQHYRIMLAELGRNTPVCGMIQLGGNESCLQILTDLSESGNNILDSTSSEKMSIVQQQIPVIAAFLTGFPEKLPEHSRQLLFDLVNMIKQTFSVPTPSKSYYTEQTESPCDVFPSLPKVHGHGMYEADKKASTDKNEQCRKESWGHPTLSPGIFTLYCPHGTCYGFSILENHESPRHPFEILKTRFETAPKVIVYDNACKLHQYALLREPEFFKNTLFLVDKFHWKGHTACSLGYNLSLYESHDLLKRINSQINEQGNAGVQKLKGHLSYMTFGNFKFHVKLYYAIRNIQRAS